MTRLLWDQTGEKEFETGVDRGVLYVSTLVSGIADDYGFPWSGIKSVNEAPTGGEITPLYQNGIRFLNGQAIEEYSSTIEAYMTPPEFAQCEGITPFTSDIPKGLYIAQQSRRSFGLSYRTLKGNDTEDTSLGYKIHLIYGAKAEPTSRKNSTVSDTPDANLLSWKISTVPVTHILTGSHASHLIVDSTETDYDTLLDLEDILYGTNSTLARLPDLDELFTLFG